MILMADLLIWNPVKLLDSQMTLVAMLRVTQLAVTMMIMMQSLIKVCLLNADSNFLQK